MLVLCLCVWWNEHEIDHLLKGDMLRMGLINTTGCRSDVCEKVLFVHSLPPRTPYHLGLDERWSNGLILPQVQSHPLLIPHLFCPMRFLHTSSDCKPFLLLHGWEIVWKVDQAMGFEVKMRQKCWWLWLGPFLLCEDETLHGKRKWVICKRLGKMYKR